jgi:hypothetical protein
MAHQAIQGQRGPERQQGVDLRHARLQRELHGEGQQQRGQHSHAAIPQPPPQVVGQQQRAQCRQQGRQQERQARASRQRLETPNGPEEHRRFVGIGVTADMGNQPLSRREHFAGDLGKAGLIGRPGVAQPQAGRKQHQSQEEQHKAIAPPTDSVLQGCCLHQDFR